ncbi:hypothetical protein B0T17DRAFT_617977 [Bombardia bombarda]|uniref:Glycosyl transferase CAP10 domain-containing protein n=1 Tax=Bombardia bombarda TaxID=252184 RepID=A0AA39WU13_9PEZI|nr:hypothetical protein B0T17DRAFT_617977 [Bombardia bombarda]
MRSRQLVLIGLFLFLAYCTYSIFGPSSALRGTQIAKGRLGSSVKQQPSPISKDPADVRPKPAPGGSHPIWHLVTQAERELMATKARQSRTLAGAVAEYRRRHGMPPPPHFDKWFEFAKSKGVQLIDEFDTVNELITPFWGLAPATTRARAKEALGFNNALMGLQIRDGKVVYVTGTAVWMQDATRDMMAPFVQYLPDMDLCFNVHDEPRVIVPHEDMARLIERAKTVNIPAANAVAQPADQFTKATGLNEVGHFEETKLTRFNVFPHQPTWTHARMSCPPDSPSRALDEADQADAVGRYGLGELGFVYNATAMSDICLSPSLRESYGFFDRPNAFNVVHDLFPIFSQSKLSSFADIIYPSPWYWVEMVPYNETKDMAWADKEDKLYWRGSTTGGFSRNGGWRRQHRQRFVKKINAGDQAKILSNAGSDSSQKWQVQEVPRGDYGKMMDVHFSHIGQCDPGDCDAQKEYFGLKDYAEQSEAFRYKYVLDIDGNAFSGRFYAFLKSRSLVYKWAVFREWHYEWLKPWAHYIPMSLQGDDWLESVRFFEDGDELGKKEAERIAMQSREWAGQVLRKEDMEAWLFRLLLEYARVIDDNRESIGFVA